ncbi:MAG: YHS domain-containing protein [Solirubrobacteraceae bacterium]
MLNLLGLVAFAALFWLTGRRAVSDPVCGMKVDRAKALTKNYAGQTYFFCRTHCLHAFEADPGRYAKANHHPVEACVAEHEGGNANHTTGELETFRAKP